ncbi:MAG TPA: SDR family NAD(P)-dependent oxidoreductase [Planctomycetota bacterium]|nr:SDR family NAD(P)-dependent oxidoreductase [Planctomycetota bacterium]
MPLPKDRVVLITGASSGIGRAAAIAFAKDGARVVVAARNRERLDELAKEIGATALAVTCDVRHRSQVRAAVDAAVAKFGALHVAIANAGFGIYHTAARMRDEDLDAVFRTNVYGAVYTIQEALPHLRKARGQAIFVTSVLGKAVTPGGASYNMSKHAMTAYADSLRMEEPKGGIDVIVVGPGQTASDFQANAENRFKDFLPARDNKGGWSSERVAKAILKASKRRKREVYLTIEGRALLALRPWIPGIADKIVRKVSGPLPTEET